MRLPDAVPRFLLPYAAAVLTAARDDGNIERITGLSNRRWRELGRVYPGLGADPGPRAARARLRLEFLTGRALATDRHFPRWRGSPVDRVPTVYVTAHIGDLRALRYLLRLYTPAATVLPEVGERARIAREDAVRDQKATGRGFPHVLPASRPHGLRAALRSGSLIIAADRPPDGGVEARLLGSVMPLDPRPFRLARLAGVPVRPVFLTAPRGRLAVTLGDRLSDSDAGAVEVFGEALGRVSDESPSDWDGVTLWDALADRR